MGRLLRTFPPRMIDALYRTQTYVDRRRGMSDPEQERRIERAEALAPMPVAPRVITESVKWGSKTFDPASQLTGGGESTTVTVTGIDANGGWVCVCGLTSLPNNWIISANATATDTCSVRLRNDSAATSDPASGTLTCRCAKKIG